MTFRSEKPLDGTDWRLLAEPQSDGRLSFKELGHKLSGDHCGEMRSSVVLSTQYDGRPVEPPVENFLHASEPEGWSR